MTFSICGLDPSPFRHLYGMPDADLATLGVERHVATICPGFPDRVELRDARLGETVLLLNFLHQPGATPFRSSHAIYVLEGAEKPAEFLGEIPDVLRSRPISVRAFSAEGRLVEADLAAGAELAAVIERLFANPAAAYLHAHYARQGCFAARIDRA